MSQSLVHYIPIATTILTVPFALEIFRRYRHHPDRVHLLWWAIGVGTVDLLLPRRRANLLTVLLLSLIAIAATAAILSPIDYSRVEAHRLTGRVFAWTWVRRFSPFINLYAVVFLIGGAILSAIRYSRQPDTRHRMVANVLIAIGAILPGIGGTATRMGYVEVLYVTEFIGLLLIWTGYRLSVLPVVTRAVRA